MTLLASQIVLRPVISEKSMDETQRGKYTFAVHDDANKLMIKDAVEELFKVTVVDVNVLTTKAKEKSRSRSRSPPMAPPALALSTMGMQPSERLFATFCRSRDGCRSPIRRRRSRSRMIG